MGEKGRLTRRQKAAEELLFIIVIILVTFSVLLVSGFFQVVSTIFTPRESLQAKLQGLQVFYWFVPDTNGEDGGGPGWMPLGEYERFARSFPLAVQFRALDDHAYGQLVVVDADWVVDDPERIDLQVNEDEKATLSILGQVQSRLEVTSSGSSKTFYIQAVYTDPLCSQARVKITTEPQPDLPAQTCRVILLPFIQKDAPAVFPESEYHPAYP